jgi:hypothetical protein
MAWQHVIVSLRQKESRDPRSGARIHQRTDDVGAQSANESNGVRDSACSPASRSISKSHSLDVLNVESYDSDKHDRTSMTDLSLPTPNAPPASNLCKLFTIA